MHEAIEIHVQLGTLAFSDYSEHFCESNVLGVQCHTVRVRQRAPQGEDGATRPAVEARTKLEQI